jgi:hypothetical protein
MRRFIVMVVFSLMVAGASLAPAESASAGWAWGRTSDAPIERGR